MTSTEFYHLYLRQQAEFMGRNLTGRPDPAGLQALSATLTEVKQLIMEQDIPAYMAWCFRWAKTHRLRADHRLLRSRKLMSAYLQSMSTRLRRSPAPVATLETDAVMAKPKDFQSELESLVTAANRVYSGQRDSGAGYALSVALDALSFRNRAKLEGLVQRFLAGNPDAVTALSKAGFHASTDRSV